MWWRWGDSHPFVYKCLKCIQNNWLLIISATKWCYEIGFKVFSVQFLAWQSESLRLVIAPSDLVVSVAIEAISRTGVEANMLDQLVFGNVMHIEHRDMYLSRVATIGAGVIATSTALTLNRLC